MSPSDRAYAWSNLQETKFICKYAYDSAGQREHCLIEEVPAGTKGTN